MSIAALTTIFTPPASCIASENIWWIWKSTALDTTTQSLIWHQLGPPSASDCFPPSYTPGSTAYYTPGRCPSGYTAAQTIVSSAGTVTETVQTCCPAPYRFRARETDAVISNGFEYQSELLCWSQFQGATSMPITKSSAGTAEQEDFSFGTDATLHAYGVVVRFQSDDFNPTLSSTQPTATGQTSPSATPSSPTSAPTSTSTSQSDSGLSAGAKAGIGAGVAAGVLGTLLIVAIVYIFRQKKKKKQMKQMPDHPGWQGSHGHGNVDGHLGGEAKYPPTDFMHQVNVPPQEMDAQIPPRELSGQSPQIGKRHL